MPVPTFRAVISTPGIKAPLASDTVPPTIALTWENRSIDTAEQNSSSAANPITIRFMSPPRPVNNFCVAYTAWRSRSIGWRRFLAADCADCADGEFGDGDRISEFLKYNKFGL